MPAITALQSSRLAFHKAPLGERSQRTHATGNRLPILQRRPALGWTHGADIQLEAARGADMADTADGN